jgi:hypothetical protein
MSNAAHQLQRETEAARVLRAQISALDGVDEDTIRDTIEGETKLDSLIAQVVEDIAIDSASIDGIKAHIETMRGRKERLEARIESRRTAVLMAMTMGEIKKLELPVATLSRKPVPPKVQVVDEAQIPSAFWRRSDPTLDKRALLDALKGEQVIPGASLSNGGETLSLRWS